MNKLLIICFFFTQISFSQNEDIDVLITRYLNRSKSAEEISYLKKNIKGVKTYLKYLPTISPIENNDFKGFSSYYGYRIHPVHKVKKFHKGIDIRAPLASVIKATANGIIEKVKISDNGYGFQVLIKHKFGYKTRYAHLYYIKVKKGATVKKGEVIGFVGSTGTSTGYHLHYEVIKNNSTLNPINFLAID